jgi:hypothetical protein
MDELELIYDAIIDGEKYGDKEDLQEDEFRQRIAIGIFEENSEKFKIVEIVDLNNTNFFNVTLIDQKPRTIKGKLLQNIVRRKGYGKLGYQKLYKEYLKYD